MPYIYFYDGVRYELRDDGSLWSFYTVNGENGFSIERGPDPDVVFSHMKWWKLITD